MTTDDAKLRTLTRISQALGLTISELLMRQERPPSHVGREPKIDAAQLRAWLDRPGDNEANVRLREIARVLGTGDEPT